MEAGDPVKIHFLPLDLFKRVIAYSQSSSKERDDTPQYLHSLYVQCGRY